MPKYAYECINCKEITTEFRKIADSTPIVKCEKCGGITTQILGATFLNFKGTGWTDNGWC